MERTYIFGGDGNGGGSKLDVNAILPGLMGGRSFDPNLLALMGNRNGFGGQDGWWSIIWLVVIASGTTEASADAVVLAAGSTGFRQSLQGTQDASC